MRRRWIYRGGDAVAEFAGDNLVWAKPEYYAPADKAGAPIFMPDIQPYQSMVTGELIGSRSQHREHLKRHNLVEIGNETKYLTKGRQTQIDSRSAERRKEMVAALVDKHR